ncbi:MAG: hypothetical protein JXR91_13235, partial [Deltaproteobacteria bacterium]|nr:hypothetical protein [Deltaproteobacteria bacterium]
SENNYPGSYEINKDDNLNLKISTTKIALNKYKQQLDEGGVGMDLSGTVYDSVYFEINQIFTDATISIRRNVDADTWFVEGTYNSEMTKDDITLYQKGLASSSQSNSTDYYCDSNNLAQIGTANHKLDLSGGTFNFTDGGSFNYSLESY